MVVRHRTPCARSYCLPADRLETQRPSRSHHLCHLTHALSYQTVGTQTKAQEVTPETSKLREKTIIKEIERVREWKTFVFVCVSCVRFFSFIKAMGL